MNDIIEQKNLKRLAPYPIHMSKIKRVIVSDINPLSNHSIDFLGKDSSLDKIEEESEKFDQIIIDKVKINADTEFEIEFERTLYFCKKHKVFLCFRIF